MKQIKLSYSDLYNAGDLMNVDIVELLSGRKVRRTKTFAAEMTAIGGALIGLQYSNDGLRRCCQHVFRVVYGNRPVYIWGSGFLNDFNSNAFFRRNLKICALRGKKTQQKLLELTGNFYDVPLADPGLLVDRLVAEAGEKKYKVGLIPHLSQQDEAGMKKMANLPGVHYINIRTTPQKAAQEISQCEAIASSSLHGLIFADALHIPNIHILGEHELKDGNFKFEDYYSSFGLEDTPCILGKHVPDYEEIVARYRVDAGAVERKKQELLDSFPLF